MLSVTLVNEQVVTDRLTKITALLVDLNPILDEAGALLLARTRQRYLAQTDPDGNPWIPSRAALYRESHGIGGGTLYDTGRLFNSIQLYAEGDNGRAIGTNVEYAAQHQLGLSGVFRVFLGFSQDDVDVSTKLVLKRIQDAFA